MGAGHRGPRDRWRPSVDPRARERRRGRADLPRAGAGRGRPLPVLQGVDSIFATDLFLPMIETAESITGRTYGDDERTDVGLRIMADHGRAMSMLVADGVLPANEGRGYVLRRIIRRAVRRARQLGVDVACH